MTGIASQDIKVLETRSRDQALIRWMRSASIDCGNLAETLPCLAGRGDAKASAVVLQRFGHGLSVPDRRQGRILSASPRRIDTASPALLSETEIALLARRLRLVPIDRHHGRSTPSMENGTSRVEVLETTRHTRIWGREIFPKFSVMVAVCSSLPELMPPEL